MSDTSRTLATLRAAHQAAAACRDAHPEGAYVEAAAWFEAHAREFWAWPGDKLFAEEWARLVVEWVETRDGKDR